MSAAPSPAFTLWLDVDVTNERCAVDADARAQLLPNEDDSVDDDVSLLLSVVERASVSVGDSALGGDEDAFLKPFTEAISVLPDCFSLLTIACELHLTCCSFLSGLSKRCSRSCSTATSQSRLMYVIVRKAEARLHSSA